MDNYKKLLIDEYKDLYFQLNKRCNFNEQDGVNIIKENLDNIYFLKDINESVAIEALKLNGMLLPFLTKKIGKQTDLMVVTAIKNNWQSIKFVKEQKEEFCILAIKENWQAIRFIRKQTNKIMNELILAEPLAYKYLDKPTKKHQIDAIRTNPQAIEFIYDSTPCNEAILLAVRTDGSLLKHVFMRHQNKKINLEAVKNNPLALEFAIKQDEEIILQAVLKNGLMLQYAHYQNEKIVKSALNNNAKSFLFVLDDFGSEIDILAVEKNPSNLLLVSNQTPEIAYRAVSKNKNLLPYINEDLFLEEKKGFLKKFW